MVMVPREEHSTEPCMKAKQDELDKLDNFETNEIVDDEGQFRISAKIFSIFKFVVESNNPGAGHCVQG